MRSLAPLALLVALVLSVPPASAQDVPTIYLYVNDLASPGALLDFEEADLSDLCYEVDARTSAEIAILVVNSTLPLDIDTYAVRTFEENGIGKEGRDNGVLVLVVTDDAAWRIEVGYGLEYILTDAKVAGFARDWLEPQLAIGDYYAGIYDVTLAIGQEIVDRYEEGPPTDPQPWVIDWGAICIALVVMVIIAGLTRGRVYFLYLPRLFMRGRFGGGRSGGGGASGR